MANANSASRGPCLPRLMRPLLSLQQLNQAAVQLRSEEGISIYRTWAYS